MTHSSAELKRMARIALGGKWGSAALFTLFSGIFSFGFSLISILFNSPKTLVGGMICWIANVIISLISGLFSAGISYYYLNICRGRRFGFGDLFAAFRMDPDRFLIVSLIAGSINFLFLLPTYVWIPEDPNDLGYLMFSLVILYAGIIFSMIISLFFALSRFLLLDFPEMGALESLRLSAYLMKGNKWRYFYISLSFVGWVLLSMFTFFIGLLWIEPYMNMTITYFYEDILTQVNNRQRAEAEAAARENIQNEYVVPGEDAIPKENIVSQESIIPEEIVVPQESSISEENAASDTNTIPTDNNSLNK